MNKYLKEIILLSKWYNKELTDDEFLEKFKLEKIRYRREVPEIAKEKLKLLAKNDKDIIREHVEDTFEMYKLS